MSFRLDISNTDTLIDENLQALSQLVQLVSQLSPDQYQRQLGFHGQHVAGKLMAVQGIYIIR